MIYDISIICLRFSVDKHVQEKRIFWVQQRREIPTAFRLCSVRQPWLTCMRHKGISYNHPKLCNAKLVAQVYIYIHIWLYIIIHIYTHTFRGVWASQKYRTSRLALSNHQEISHLPNGHWEGSSLFWTKYTVPKDPWQVRENPTFLAGKIKHSHPLGVDTRLWHPEPDCLMPMFHDVPTLQCWGMLGYTLWGKTKCIHPTTSNFPGLSSRKIITGVFLERDRYQKKILETSNRSL